MGFLRRDRDDRTGPGQQVGQDDLMKVLGLEPEMAIKELEHVVIEGMGEAPLKRETLELLQVGLPYLLQRECSDQAVIAGQTAARLGYLSRAAEYAMCEGDLAMDDELYDTLSESFEQAEKEGMSSYDAMGDLAAAMATGESLDPSPHEGGPSWTLPGLPGQVRGRLRDNLVSRMQCPSDVLVDDLRRTWKYGYFLCALDELCED